MPALNFKPQFENLIIVGAKRQTIRAPRKHPIKPGDTLYLYRGMRTQHCRLLMVTLCTKVQKITFERFNNVVPVVSLDGRELDAPEFERLAKKDGFDSLGDFLLFFQDEFDQGVTWDLIHWEWPECKA